jgi:hypothetical protein
MPGTEVLTQIEGVSIIDLSPPGSIAGVATGVVAGVGECSDMTYATQADTSGNISTKIRPQEIFSGQDLINKIGGFDETLGEFGVSSGNLYAQLRNKRYSRLIAVPVNLASAKGARFFRELPVCRSQSDANPVVPVLGGSIAAGREFKNTTLGRIRVGKRVEFTALDVIAKATSGQTVAGASAATQTIASGAIAEQVWQVTASGPTFSDQTSAFNTATPADFTPFPTVETVGDYVAFGMAAQFSKLTLSNVGGTQGVAGVVAWEYWNGSAWTALTVTDGTSGFTAALTSGQTVTWTAPSDWATLALNAITKYYVRARVTTVYTTNPIYSQGFVGGQDWAAIVRPDGQLGAAKGDIVVVGYNNAGAKAPSAEAGTYRVATTPSSGITLSIERLDGASFTFTANNNVPWRLHFASDADTAPVLVPGSATPGGYAASDAGGYVVPVRPVTNSTGGATDGTFAAGTVLTPAVVPDAADGDSWDPLSGLGARTIVGATTSFTAAVQGINAAASASIDALYSTAFDAMLSDDTPTRDINLVGAARTSSNIRTALKAHVLEASKRGRGRCAVISPDLGQQSVNAVNVDASPGVGATRDERVFYAWPGERTYIPEAVNYRLRTADTNTTVDGILDIRSDFRLLSILSNLPPERNPGQAAEPVPSLMSSVLGLQRGVTDLGINEYTALRAAGIVALRIDRTAGPIYQSGVTSSLISGKKNINRRRMADFIQDSLAERAVQFSKLPLTTQLKDGLVAETDAFLTELLSPNNPSAQRINAYQVDDKSGNTPDLEAKGIFIVITRVRTTPTADFIVLQTEVGENVVIVQEVA